MRLIAIVLTCFISFSSVLAQRYTDSEGRLRVALLKQPYSPTGTSAGPTTMANGGEVMGHGNKVPNGPSSEQLAKLFEAIFSRYEKASAIGFATIPSTDEGGLSIAAVNRMIAGAVRGLKMRETRKANTK